MTLSSSIIDNGKQTKKRGPQNSIIIEIVKSKNQQGNQTRESCFLPGDPVNSDHLPHLVSGKKSKTKVTTHTHLAMNSAAVPKFVPEESRCHGACDLFTYTRSVGVYP